MRSTYFGTTREEEVRRIKDLWKKSLLVFIIVGAFMTFAEGNLLAGLSGIVPFFLVWGFQACFSKAGSVISFITDLIPIEILKYTVFFLGTFIGMFYFVLGNIKLYTITKN